MRGNHKEAQVLGEGMIMMYRLLLVSLVALIVLGISAVFYSHYINVRDAEAIVMSRNIAGCLIDGDLNFDEILAENKGILTACGYDAQEIERFFVRVTLDSGKEKLIFSEGDSGATWVLEVFGGDYSTEEIKQYKPGYYNFSFPLIYNQKDYNVKMEVLVRDEI